MYRLDGVGRVSHSADVFWILEVDRQVSPLAAPGFDNNRIEIALAVLQFVQCYFCGIDS